MTRRRSITGVLAAGLLVGLGLVLLAPASPASAHPLGNFSVNQLAALSLYSDRIEVAATVDAAELPTLQEKSTVDSSGDGVVGEGERAVNAARGCAAFADSFDVSVADRSLKWTVGTTGFEYAEGAAGLPTSRLTCHLSAAAALSSPAPVRVANKYRSDRIGWCELTAVGKGVRLVGSVLPTASRTGGDLRSYPENLLSSPPNVRTAELRVQPGTGADAAAVGSRTSDSGSWVGGLVGAAESQLNDLVAYGGRTPLIGVLAVLLALVLGGAHAALPGHGKTVMAAYLAGKHGRARDALGVGAVVTLTHTGGVLVVGLLLTSVVGLAGQTVLGWLGVVSGTVIVVVGAAMLRDVRRRGHGHHGHTHGHDHGNGHGHHHHPANHDHAGQRRPGRLGIAAIGVAGGLVPSPSALIILLGAVGLGRTWFGVLLVVAYGLGMAATLTAAGLLLVVARRRWALRAGAAGRWRGWVGRLSAVAPAATGSLVLLVGLGVVGRAAAALV